MGIIFNHYKVAFLHEQYDVYVNSIIYICTTNIRLIFKMKAEKTQKKRIMKFITYYRGLKTKQKGELKALIITACDFSESSFHYKMENLNYSKLEIDAIEKVIEKFKEDGTKES